MAAASLWPHAFRQRRRDHHRPSTLIYYTLRQYDEAHFVDFDMLSMLYCHDATYTGDENDALFALIASADVNFQDAGGYIDARQYFALDDIGRSVAACRDNTPVLESL